ncbi:glycosyltransferase family 39 protein [Chloroflexus sp.]|uniref:glycosyltransferase family 39 protein n=1 Tax=Chloroflexus sp. TaxID=1904827 RepID=UPI002621D1B6|nr:glycosyltransferase family 39 protein [uncultured Chloroflexus sp.]
MKRETWWIVAILGLAALIRLALWLQPLHLPANDEVEYLTVAQDLLAGRGWSFYDRYHWLRAPLYPLFLAASLWLAQGNVWLAALPNIALSVLNVYLMYRLSQAIGDGASPLAHRLVALVAAILLTHATFAALYMSETLFTTLFSAALWLLLAWREKGGRWQDWRLLVAGALWGLALLTRSMPLYFTVLVAGWIALEAAGHWRQVFHRPTALLAGVSFAVIALTVVAPWTIRNCLSYRSCILIETGLSYNLWAFNEPREDMATIFRALENIADPSERATYATARGLERLREDPAILLRKLWPNWLAIWRVKAIQDRFLLEDYRADPPPLLFLMALITDDLLYGMVAVGGVAALLYGTLLGRAPARLLILWVLYFIAVSLLTHGEGRYRHFIFCVLIPYAVRAWLALPKLSRLAQPALTAGLLAAGIVGCSALLAYHWDYAIQGGTRSFWRLSGDLARISNNLPGATIAYQQAVSAQPTPDGYIALGDVLRAQGKHDEALAAYRAAQRLNILYPPPYTRLGDLLRERGELAEAQQFYRPQYVSEQTLLDLAWRDTTPIPRKVIEVGDGLDFGYLSGFYPGEELAGTRARWTGPVARIRIPAEARIVRLRIAALRPDAPIVGQICIDNRCQPFQLGIEWRWLELQLQPSDTVSPLREIEFRLTPWSAPDNRRLGIVVDQVEASTGN